MDSFVANKCNANGKTGASSTVRLAVLHVLRCKKNNHSFKPLQLRLSRQRLTAALRASVRHQPGEGSGAGGGGAGSGSGGGGGSGDINSGGGPHEQPPFRLTTPSVLAALLYYTGFLLSAATAWDAVLDTRLPRVDTTGASVSVIIPALNEAQVIEETVRHVLTDLQPPPSEVIVVDGGSTDGTPQAARRAGATVVRSAGRGRGLQMNAGAQVAKGEVLIFLHADTRLPADAVTEVRAALASPRVVLVGFRPEIQDKSRTLWFSTLNNLTKTWYGPMIVRPASYVRGLRCLFGDQGMSCRAADLRAVGGFRSDIPFMEDADLCIALHMAGPADQSLHKGRGRVRMLLGSPAVTSGRRIAAWGELRSNAIFAYVSLLWLAGASPASLHATYRQMYGDVR